MHNELTPKDLQLMREELDYRRIQLRPQLLEAVKEARAFGDLSENFEYKAAKQEKNKNESRIRYLENMIRTAVVISDQAAEDAVDHGEHGHAQHHARKAEQAAEEQDGEQHPEGCQPRGVPQDLGA